MVKCLEGGPWGFWEAGDILCIHLMLATWVYSIGENSLSCTLMIYTLFCICHTSIKNSEPEEGGNFALLSPVPRFLPFNSPQNHV